jgi:hypothetical protein
VLPCTASIVKRATSVRTARLRLSCSILVNSGIVCIVSLTSISHSHTVHTCAGKPWTYRLEIKRATNLPVFCELAYVSYDFFGESFTTGTHPLLHCLSVLMGLGDQPSRCY